MSDAPGTVRRTCLVIDSLIRGAVHDRHTLARNFGVGLAAADRYMRELAGVPGVVTFKSGRRLTVRWSFTDAIREAGL